MAKTFAGSSSKRVSFRGVGHAPTHQRPTGEARTHRLPAGLRGGRVGSRTPQRRSPLRPSCSQPSPVSRAAGSLGRAARSPLLPSLCRGAGAGRCLVRGLLAVNPRSSKNLMGHAKTSLGYAAFVHGYPVPIHLVKPVVHTRLCMAFNSLKQLPENILLSKSYDMTKSSMPKSGHTRHIPA